MDLTRAWKVVDSGGTDRTEVLAPYFKRLTVHDRNGKLADDAIFTLANDPSVELPNLGRAFTIYMGETSRDLVNIGTHYVTDYGIGGSPHELDVVTRPIYFGGGSDPDDVEAPSKAQEARDATYLATTLGQIAQTVAGRLGVDLAIGPDFAPFTIDQVEQRRESDPAFITRMSRLAGAMAKLAPGILVIGTPHDLQSYGRSANLPSLELLEEEVASYRFGWSARKAPGTVVCDWFNVKTGQWRRESVGNDPPITAVKKTHGSRQAAINAATSFYSRLARQKQGASVSFNQLRLRLWVGSKITIGAPWHPVIRDTWEVVQVTHELTSGGGTTSVDIERQTDNG